MTKSNSGFQGLTSELEAEFGHGEAIGPCALAFTLDNDGDGVVYTRAARADNAGQLIQQAQLCIEFAERAGLKPRRLLVSECSGLAPFPGSPGREAHNPGLQALLDDAASPWCSWVAYQRTDRLSRDPAVVEATVSRLRASNVELLTVDGYCFAGAVVDEQTALEVLEKAMRTAIHQFDRADMKERIAAGQKARRERDKAK